MTDPVAEAAKQLAETEPSLIDEIKAGIHTLGEKVEHLIHPEQSAEVAQAGEQQSASETLSVSTIAENSSSSASQPSTEVTTEHPHTTILRHMTQTLRRKFNLFDGELEAIIKDAESHL